MNKSNAVRLGNKAAIGVFALVIGSIGFGTPAYSAPADLELIQSYVGDWRGRGTLNAPGQESETVVCRLNIKRSSAEKINYSGRCTVAGGNVSMNGTMAYISANNRYEAIMTSNTAFTGVAIGRRSGKNVTFNLQAQDDDGRTSNVRAGFGLVGDNIKVDFEITRADGSKMVADIPFDRR
ncbi:MAG TPA: DUF1794 domain-containing protein [Devosia sp.]|nr:DUF1794 domain-containing protein [Devosia sp.]